MDSKEREARMVEQLREEVGNLLAAAQLLTPAIREREERNYDQYLAILNQGLYRLLRLTEHADLSRQGELPCRMQGVEAMGLCEELCRQVESLCAGMDRHFQWECASEETQLWGDPALLRRLILMLVDGALRRTPADGRAGLRAWKEGGRFRLAVWSDGEAAPRPVCPEAGGAERLADDGALERSLAQAITAAHGGALVLERGESGGRAALSIPLSVREEGRLHTPRMGYDPNGGFQPALVELSEWLSYRAYLWQELE